MRRVQFIELHDQPWFPAFLRDEVTGDLQVLLGIGKPYGDILPELREAMERSGASRVLDLCSGAGGPWPWLSAMLERSGFPVCVELSDKYPNVAAQAGAERRWPNVRYRAESVDARRVPAGFAGFRTLFTSFHHFPPPAAREILRDAAVAGEGIGVFEIPGRRPLTLLLMPFVPLGDILLVPFLRFGELRRTPVKWLFHLLWRWLLPIVPLVLLFDGVVSCLRAYSPRELRELTDGIAAPGAYTWRAGCVKRGLFRLPITYLIGHPEHARIRKTFNDSVRTNRELLERLARERS